MNQEVPQPTTATRWPVAGSTPSRPAASRTASRQVSGWLSISWAMNSVELTCTSCFLSEERGRQQVAVGLEQLVAHGHDLGRGQGGGGVWVQQGRLVDVVPGLLQRGRHAQLDHVQE